MNIFLGNATSPPVSGTSTSPRTTTIAVPDTTATAAPPAEPKINLKFRLIQTFVAALSDKFSPEFQQLKGTIETAVS